MDPTLEVLEQVAPASDVPGIEQPEAQIEKAVSFVPQPTAKQEVKEPKKERISQAEWQDRTEKAAEGQKLKETAQSTLGVQTPEEMLELSNRIKQLEEDNRRKEWEATHPIVRNEKYEQDWVKVNKEERFSQLTYEEKWALISKETSRVKEEFRAQEAEKSASPTVPFLSKGTPQKSTIDSTVMEYLRAVYPGITEEEAAKLG